MKKRRLIGMFGLLFSLLLTHSFLPAFAQLGVGAGAWNWGGGSGYGTWFGVSLWPHRRHSYSLPPSRAEISPKADGYLEGTLTVRPICPPAQAQADHSPNSQAPPNQPLSNQPPSSQSNAACPLTPDVLNSVTIAAQPYGAKQWLIAKPDAQGRFRLTLPPGGYNISLHHPALSNSDQVLRQIIIQPGQTNRQDFRIDLPVQ